MSEEEQDIKLAKKLAKAWGYDWSCNDKTDQLCDFGDCLDCCGWDCTGEDARKDFVKMAKVSREHLTQSPQG